MSEKFPTEALCNIADWFRDSAMTAHEVTLRSALSAHAATEARIAAALDVLVRYGQTDGAHHKAWVIDRAVRALTGAGYPEVIRKAKEGEDGPETYGWDEGIAP